MLSAPFDHRQFMTNHRTLPLPNIRSDGILNTIICFCFKNRNCVKIMTYDIWAHQEEAVRCFLARERGILEMATGTGKTRTAIRIIRELDRKGLIDQVIVAAHGNDLLEQWYRELLRSCPEALLFRWYGGFREFARFQLAGGMQKILLLSREAEHAEVVLKKMQRQGDRTLLIFDEVHGAGSKGFREAAEGLLEAYRFRLGLSATPVREFDEEGNRFLMRSVGPVIFQFGLSDAIRRGILCGFRYIPLDYELTAEEKRKKQRIISMYEMRRKRGEAFQEEELYRDLARVNKLAANKIPLFEAYIQKNPEILERCVIFVETREYGLDLQKMLVSHVYNFHTYYGGDDRNNLLKFAEGKIQCLITCKKIAEGINIQSVRNIVLFSSDRSRLVTTQRIGRSLRKDPGCRDKEAAIVDFICAGSEKAADDITADRERKKWLTELSKVREEAER